jgi:hypothetical protein
MADPIVSQIEEIQTDSQSSELDVQESHEMLKFLFKSLIDIKLQNEKIISDSMPNVLLLNSLFLVAFSTLYANKAVNHDFLAAATILASFGAIVNYATLKYFNSVFGNQVSREQNEKTTRLILSNKRFWSNKLEDKGDPEYNVIIANFKTSIGSINASERVAYNIIIIFIICVIWAVFASFTIYDFGAVILYSDKLAFISPYIDVLKTIGKIAVIVLTFIYLGLLIQAIRDSSSELLHRKI